MDKNKLKVLQDIEYKILPSCGICMSGAFNYKESFGVCLKHFYNHLKHKVKKRNLSIHRNGTCPDFVLSERKINLFQGWEEFLPPGGVRGGDFLIEDYWHHYPECWYGRSE